jgi:copper ion binding protein
MKRFLPLLLIVLLVLPVLAKPEKAEIVVKGMKCSMCADKVTTAVKEITGVSSVQVSLEKETATVEYDTDKTNVGALETAIANIGFDAGNTKATTPHKCDDKDSKKSATAGCCPAEQKSGCPAAKGGGCSSEKK